MNHSSMVNSSMGTGMGMGMGSNGSDSMGTNSSTGMGDSTESGMMVPYLHFLGGDYLFSSAWRPTSRDEIAAACVVLLLLAMLERSFAAMKLVFDHKRSLALVAATSERESQNCAEKSLPSAPPVANSQPARPPLPYLGTKLKLPFIAEPDILRGILFAFQMFLGYLLMLAVMTFQAAYLISIVVGLGIGEALFGRSSRIF